MAVNRMIFSLAMCGCIVASSATPASAGPLLDWLFGYRTAATPAYPVGQPVPIGNPAIAGYMPPGSAPAPGYAANYGNYYGAMMPVIGNNGYAYPSTVPSGLAAATAPTIMSYVPDYRTTNYRAPVTYYRPTLTTDPNTGAQVIALAPCTSYEYQTQRVPTFGYNGLLGSFSTPPALPPTPAFPTYTLPPGGIPLANSANLNSGYSAAYGNYSAPILPRSTLYSPYTAPYITAQPPITSYPASPSNGIGGTYPTMPSGTPAYGGGGCTGSYAVPGLSAPPSSLPGGYSSPIQGYSAPTSDPSRPVLPSQDPNANVAPSLPTTGTGAQLNRPQIRSFAVEPQSRSVTDNDSRLRTNGFDASTGFSGSTDSQKEPLSKSKLPAPIPDPEDQPKWNSGLLNERDRTASNPSRSGSTQTVGPAYHENLARAGQSKPIHWASFESPVRSSGAAETTPQLELSAPIRQPKSTTKEKGSLAPVEPAARKSYPTGGWQATR